MSYGKCAGCDSYEDLDDIQLCESCAEKVEIEL